VGAGCSVDLFVMNNSYVDIATIGQVSRLTGGEVYKYTYFQVRRDFLRSACLRKIKIGRVLGSRISLKFLLNIFRSNLLLSRFSFFSGTHSLMIAFSRFPSILPQADIDGARLVQDIIKNISRPVAFDTVMRVRTSAGVRPTDFYGHFYMANTTDMEVASIGE
jgi:Sec23/Sec24 trunk domain